MKLRKNKTLCVFVIGIIIMLAGSIIAQAFHTSGHSVNVSRISFETETGVLSGLLYLPDGTDANNPRPTIVTTHGYLNSAEMQDAPAIEMSRRGYVVLALDMYDHGHSAGNAENTGSFLNFWPTAIWDGVQYMYSQDYVMKDADGNGVIAVSGHSMGGFSSTMALYYDELAYQATNVRMIMAGLSAGSDYSYTEWLGLDVQTAVDNFGGRTIGKIAAHYDEFFFNSADATGTVNYKDYVSTEAGQIILETENAVSDTWYDTSDGGQRIIYEPGQIHPWNHFSKTTTADMISFYEVAFADYQDSLNAIDADSQIWMFKELFELVAMIGFFMVIVAAILMLLNVPFLKNAIVGQPIITEGSRSLTETIGTTALFIASMLIPAIIFATVYDGNFSAEASMWLRFAADITIVIGIIAICISAKSTDKNKKTWISGSILAIVCGLGLRTLVTTPVFSTSKIFQAPSVNSIVTWAVICACISGIIMTAVYLFGNKKEHSVSLEHYGIKGNATNIVAACLVAVIAVIFAYALVFIIDAVFKTDFRIWVFAVKSFEASALTASLKYMPFFFIYYFVSGVAVISNTSSKKLQGVWGYILAMLTNMGGITIWLIMQYGKLFLTGSAYWPTQALSGILLFALVPTLALASWLTKFLYKKTGSVYVAAFFNTIFITIMTVANTAVYFQ